MRQSHRLLPILSFLFLIPAVSVAEEPAADHMFAVPYLQGDPAQILWPRVPKLKADWAIVSEGTPEWKFRLHSYLCYYDARFWAMWSHGPVVEDHPTQHVRYATSDDGLHWSEAKAMMPPDPDPEFRYISRGFWIRDGKLLALASRDEAKTNGRIHFFGKSLALRAYEWDRESGSWKYAGVVYDDAINNFPPKKLPSGAWMMSRRDHKMNKSMLIGGVKSISDWKAVPIAQPKDGARLEEPFWWILPDNTLAGIFRDNSRSKRLYRAFSQDNGQTWTEPVRTDFPDATSKFNALRTSRGYYVLVNNANPRARNPLCLSTSDDGRVFTRLAALPTPGDGSFQYPHVLEKDGYVFVLYSHNKTSIEVLRVSFDEIERLRKLEVDEPLVRSADMKNVAVGAKVAASSHWGEFTPENAIDGDAVNRPSRWLSDPKAEMPQWLDVTFDEPKSVTWITLTFFANFASTDYELQYDKDGRWVTFDGASVRDGGRNVCVADFPVRPAVTTKKVRFLCTNGCPYETSFGNIVRLFEIEIFGE